MGPGNIGKYGVVMMFTSSFCDRSAFLDAGHAPPSAPRAPSSLVECQNQNDRLGRDRTRGVQAIHKGHREGCEIAATRAVVPDLQCTLSFLSQACTCATAPLRLCPLPLPRTPPGRRVSHACYVLDAAGRSLAILHCFSDSPISVCLRDCR